MNRRVGAFFANTAALLLAFLVTYVLRFGWVPDDAAFNNVNETVVLAHLLLSFFIVFMFYHPKAVPGRRTLLRLFKETFITTLLTAAVFSTLVYASHISSSVPRMFFAYFFAIDFLLTFAFSSAVHLIKKGYQKRHRRKTVVFTDEKDKSEVVRRLLREGRDDIDIIGVVQLAEKGKDTYYQVKTINEATNKRLSAAGLIEVDPELLKFEFTPAKVDSVTFLKRHQVDQTIISVTHFERERIRGIVDLVGEMGIDSMITLDTLAMDTFESKLEDFGTMQVIRFAPRIFTDSELMVKRLMDILGALVGCVICIVVGIFVVPLIFFSDPGPVIFKQQRVGRNGKYFYIFKFRSMYKDAEERLASLKEQNEMDGMMFKMKNDPRITKVGKFIRRTSIDELPQFFNVLFGDMSLVGTRPPTVAEYNQYSRHHKRRLTLKPGITGLWQVSGRSNITDFEEIVRLDCFYIDHWSVPYDIKILLMTIGAVLSGKGSE